jgi:hypothetical protein
MKTTRIILGLALLAVAVAGLPLHPAFTIALVPGGVLLERAAMSEG